MRMTNFGAFVELDEGIEGLIHVSEFDDAAGKDKVELTVGETYPMKIIKLAPSERKIGLSIRALKSDEFRSRTGSNTRRARATARPSWAITLEIVKGLGIRDEGLEEGSGPKAQVDVALSNRARALSSFLTPPPSALSESEARYST